MSAEPKACATCAKPLSRKNRSGYCTRHVAAANAAKPEWRAKQREGAIRALRADPVRLSELRQHIRIAGKLPHAVEARRRHALDNRIWEKGSATIAANPSIRIIAGRRQSATKLAWCPAELRQAYRDLIYSTKLSAAEARELILDQHARDMAAFRAKLQAAQ